jgi:hypothetical protein
MISQKNACFFATSVLLMYSGDLAWAQQKIEEAGRNVAVRDNQVSELEEGHIVVLINTKGVIMPDDPSHPFNMAPIDCMGIVEELPDGTYKGNGYCTNTDPEGDKVFSTWSESSAAESQYELTGGTGKFEGARGEGTYTVTEVSPGPQGWHVVRWQGTVEYPNIRK